MNLTNVDRVIISLDVIEYDYKFSNFIEELERCKEISINSQKGGFDEKRKIVLHDDVYFVYPRGTRNHAYILEGYNYKLYFSQVRSSNQNFYPIKFDVSSNVLWSMSPDKACAHIYKILNWINQTFNNEPSELEIIERVSRVDLCCHTDSFQITDKTIPCFQGKYRKDNIIRNNNKIETYSIGVRKNSNPIFCRIYNKTAEVESKADKSWFIPIWKKAGLDIEEVWNIEFELHRSFFNDIRVEKDIKLDTFEEIYKHLRLLWEYCTKEWLVHKNLINTRIERCPVSKEWELIQNAYDEYEGKGYISRKKQMQTSAEHIIPCIIGYMTTFASKYKDMEIEEAFEVILKEGRAYLNKRKNSTYEIEIEEKRYKNLGLVS